MQQATVPLLRYQDVLWAVTARVGSEDGLFLLDTGAGLTVLDATLATRLGIEVTGRFAGERMTGEVVELDLARDVELEIGGRTIQHPTVGVFDLSRALPDGWPPVCGAIGLPTFQSMRATLDFGRSRLLLDTDPAPDAREIRVRARRDGPALDLFVAVHAGEHALWFEIDTANTGPVILAPATVAALGLEPDATEAALDLAGLGPVATAIVEKDIRYDGNLGAPFFAERTLTLDVAAERAWVGTAETKKGPDASPM